MRKASKVVTGTKYKSKMDRSFYMKALAVFLLGIVFLAVYFIFHNILVGFLGTWMFVALLLIFCRSTKVPIILWGTLAYLLKTVCLIK